jgi:hypothetical protein
MALASGRGSEPLPFVEDDRGQVVVLVKDEAARLVFASCPHFPLYGTWPTFEL